MHVEMNNYPTPSVRILEVRLMSLIAASGFTSSIVPGSEGEAGSVGDIIDGGDF